MEAHNFMSKRGLLVRSFGSGQQVKLPGTSLERPNVYTFDTTYEFMYKDLYNKDANLYTQNGVLHMLDRNRRIKEKPERFQDCRERFDIIFTVEERIFDQVMEGSLIQLTTILKIHSFFPIIDLENRDKRTNDIVHVINIDVVDNPEDATLGAFMLCELGQKVK
jgi:RNA polymerase II subunit A C-terminal domain phosphatase SSU72